MSSSCICSLILVLPKFNLLIDFKPKFPKDNFVFSVYFQKYLYTQYLQAFFQQVQIDKQLYKSRSPSLQDNTVRKLQQASQTYGNS